MLPVCNDTVPTVLRCADCRVLSNLYLYLLLIDYRSFLCMVSVAVAKSSLPALQYAILLGPDLQNILRQSYDYPKINSMA